MEIEDDFIEDWADQHYVNDPTYPPIGDEAANALYEQQKAALKLQIKATHAQMKATTDPDALAALNVTFTAQLQNYAINYRRLPFGVSRG
jgi:hypothetical protein